MVSVQHLTLLCQIRSYEPFSMKFTGRIRKEDCSSIETLSVCKAA